MSFVAAERARLAELLLDLGPDAPTLCQGWATRDLAAHLYLREHRLDAAAGMFLPRLARHVRAVTRAELRRPYDELVTAWAAGPGRANPWRYVDSRANLVEHFVHYEDVRRANGQTSSRAFSAVVIEQLYRALATQSRLLLRQSKLPVLLIPPNHRPILAADRNRVSSHGDAVVRVRGEVGELLLWVMGRSPVALGIDGDAAAVRWRTL